MRLHRLGLAAFGPFADAQRIDFDRLGAAGLFLLHGPTGAGKTSILDAVCYALYGAVPGARQSSVVSLRSDHAAPGTLTEVVLDLTLSGRRLEITRRPEQERPKKRGTGVTRERATALLREYDARAGAWRPLSRSHQEIGEELTRLLGMSREQFCQVVLLPQGDFARFLRSGAEDRARLLGRLFDTRRFAAAEAHLAELRARTGERVRAGDERLLAVAHRVAQAAGHPSDGLPAPGDAGLADAVLALAAQARCAARERHEIAALALRAAEERHAAAQRRLEHAREQARLARLRAEARDRGAALAAAREERAVARARLEAARAAEAVAPALALRERAEAEHRAAAEAEHRARAPLPPDLAEAPAAHLAERERAAREELGALAAARQAEERVRRLDGELARLADEDTAHAAARRAAGERLAAWPETRERLAARLAAARAAEERAGRLRRLLTAVRRRDEAERELLAAREEAAEARTRWLDVRERRLRGIAAELAAGLRPGEPCAVCGSRDHPEPAPRGADHVDRDAEEAALAAHRAAEAALAAVREAHAAAVAAEEQAAEELSPTPPLPDTGEPSIRRPPGPPGRNGKEGPADALAVAEAEAAVAEAVERELAEAEAEHAALAERHAEAERAAAARASRRETLAAERAALREEMGPGSVAERAAGLAARAAALAAAAAAVRVAEETADRLKQADAALADAAYRAGFGTPQAATEAVLDADGQQRLRRRLAAWDAEEAAVAALRREIETALAPPAAPPVGAAEGMAAAATGRLPGADSEMAAEGAAEMEAAARAELAAATDRLRAAAAEEAGARGRCADLAALSEQAAGEAAALLPARDEARRVARLAGLTSGTSPENAYRMRLETYVLAARLEQVAAAASARLHRMSAGRYTLVHSDAKAAQGARSGLGLRVVDAWTGRDRDTATLSGGESFIVSLALALGLADVVAQEAGGARLDTLFIDEGFGSLDEDSLDEVLDVLDGLREYDRSVAIVSHVPDLRSRIPAQLEVVKTRRGSAVRHRTAPFSP